jgi:GT2 family glycosyltransferase
LPALFAEFERRGVGDELVLVDDTGSGELVKWAQKALDKKPAKLVIRKENGGFAKAVEEGIREAANDLIFSMNSDVLVRPGFLAPLVQALFSTPKSKIAKRVFAAAPRVLLNGDEDRIESFAESQLDEGLLTNRSPRRPAGSSGPPESNAPIPFAIGGTFLFRKSDFEELGGFDALFAPFYFEDNDLCWRAWRGGACSVYVPSAVVEHHHKGTIGTLVSPERRRAAVERGELLFNWKHLDDEDRIDHIALLYRRALDAWLTDDRAGLIWIQLALDSLQAASTGRRAFLKEGPKASSREILNELKRPLFEGTSGDS